MGGQNPARRKLRHLLHFWANPASAFGKNPGVVFAAQPLQALPLEAWSTLLLLWQL
jgi:hypothetical protein